MRTKMRRENKKDKSENEDEEESKEKKTKEKESSRNKTFEDANDKARKKNISKLKNDKEIIDIGYDSSSR